MSQSLNRYKADLRDIHFLLFEQFGFQDVLHKEPFTEWGVEEAKMAIAEVYRFATEVMGPLNASGDREKCKLVDGAVKTPTGYKEAWKQLYEEGWRGISVSPEFDGQGAPVTLQAVMEELFSGANPSFLMYPGLSQGAADLIAHFGNKDLKERFARPMFNGRFGGTMCLTEPQAGSDVGAATTSAEPLESGAYAIQGTKIFISGGDHDMAENIVHLVLARVKGAPLGTKGLSLFAVPKIRVNEDGSLGEPNDVKVASIETKMGLNASVTCVLNFGDEDKCEGYLLGEAEHQGMRQMFQMMNYARIGVGIQSLGVAGAAYMAALDYAKDRKQGPSAKNWKDPSAPKVPIIEHADVRRMLLDMKAKVEGIRALILKLSIHGDRVRTLRGRNDDEAAYHDGQVELLTPLVKAYASEEAFLICATAIQVHGGAGYIRDYPVEQACRDAKIFSIYEGTTHIQALDLVGRKLGQAGGKHAQDLFGDIGKFVVAHKEHELLKAGIAQLAKAQEAAGGMAMQLLGWFKGGQVERVPLNANTFLMMMSEVVIGWLLLEGAVIAHEKQRALAKDHPDFFFYEGKKQAALFYAHNVLPNVVAKSKVMLSGDRSPLDIPDEAFATV